MSEGVATRQQKVELETIHKTIPRTISLLDQYTCFPVHPHSLTSVLRLLGVPLPAPSYLYERWLSAINASVQCRRILNICILNTNATHSGRIMAGRKLPSQWDASEMATKWRKTQWLEGRKLRSSRCHSLQTFSRRRSQPARGHISLS